MWVNEENGIKYFMHNRVKQKKISLVESSNALSPQHKEMH